MIRLIKNHKMQKEKSLYFLAKITAKTTIIMRVANTNKVLIGLKNGWEIGKL